MTQRGLRAIRKQINRREPQPWIGRLGDANGTVEVPGRTGFWYVRPKGSDLPVVVRGGSAPRVANTEVLVGDDPYRRGRARVLGVNVVDGGPSSEQQSVEAHWRSHLPNGSDSAQIATSQIINGLVYASTGMTIKVNAGWAMVAGALVKIVATSIDLTGDIPATGACWALVRADADGLVDVVAGTAAASLADLTYAAIPASEDGYAPLAIVRLYAGQPALSKETAQPDVIDVRFASRAYAAPGAGTLAGLDDVSIVTPHTLNVLLYDEDLGFWLNEVLLHNNLGDINGSEDGNHLSSRDYNYMSGGMFVCQGRLTLESGVPVSTADQAGKATLYFTPFRGARIAVYDGSAWNIFVLGQISLSLAALTASTLYDIFIYGDTGTETLTLEAVAWSSATARATAQTTQDGVLVKSGDATRRYLGTIYINSSGGQTDDTTTKRNVWNYYNRVERRLYTSEATLHTYSGAARLWNNSETNNRLEFALGVAEDVVSVGMRASLTGTGGFLASTTLYLDGSGLDYRATNANAYTMIGGSSGKELPAAGFPYLNLYEVGNNASSQFNNMSFNAGVWA